MKSKLWLAAAFLSFVVVVVLALLVLANPSLPPFTKGPSLTPRAKKAVSPIFDKLLSKANKYTIVEHKKLSQLNKELIDHLKFKDIAVAKAWIQKNNKVLSLLEKGLHSKGCVPVWMGSRMGKIPYRWSIWMRGLMGLALKSVVDVHELRAKKGAERLLQVSRNMYFQEEQCRMGLIMSVMNLEALKVLINAIAVVFESGAVPLDLQAKLALQLRRWETRPRSHLLDAMREEVEPFPKYFLNVGKFLGGSRTTKPSLVGDAGLYWPYFDAEETANISRELNRCLIRKLQAYPARKSMKPCPMALYLEKVNNKEAWRRMFLYNATGKLLAGMSQPSFVQFLDKFGQMKCYAGVVRTMWKSTLKIKERQHLPAKLREPASELFSTKSLYNIKPNAPVCPRAPSRIFRPLKAPPMSLWPKSK
ncbi:MAG: hypothetical protein EP343_27015 [Deltaproteobacteria bacterium]|nr:MAG: hypothetical protein EP343_27015 [Deltaproteobacteria bacterium]